VRSAGIEVGNGGDTAFLELVTCGRCDDVVDDFGGTVDAVGADWSSFELVTD